MINERGLRLAVGALLHDIGKLVYRANAEYSRHEVSGRDFLESIGIEDKEILDCVRYHHAKGLSGAKLEKDSLAYIVYMADNIASAADRRDREDTAEGKLFDRNIPLASVFNLLNGNHGDMHYSPKRTNVEEEINYPEQGNGEFEAGFYIKILNNLKVNLRAMEWTESYVHSLLEALEANLSFVPSSTSMQEVPDISLHDHMKLTAALAGCIDAYLEAQQENDYHDVLFRNGKEFYHEKAFLLTVLDLSGVQKFIYTITSENALKTLRARSFYLEILMEHVADELLSELGLTRANLLYIGGGRCSLLLPNTHSVRACLQSFLQRVNGWLIEHFDISLYLAGSYAPCSSETLQDIPSGSYGELYRTISQGLSDCKSSRYSAEEIMWLNRPAQEHIRECNVCRRAGQVDKKGRCSICAALQNLSGRILYDDFFVVVQGSSESLLPLPGGYVMDSGGAEKVRELQETGEAVRIYGKNKFYEGKSISTRLWVGDYHTGETFEELARQSKGLERLGILRADVDNLGQAFATGFVSETEGGRYVTLSRTATMSRQLSMFFKLHIKKILEHPEFTLTGEAKLQRHAAIVYSGGDDLFIVGAWDDVLELAVDLRRALKRYTEGTLTISAGFGIYPAGYPISAMAAETERLEDAAKHLPGKNGITLMETGSSHEVKDEETGRNKKVSDGSYHWDELEENVLGEMYHVIADFFSGQDERGKGFLYRLLELLRNREQKINFARYIYLLSRMEPDSTAAQEEKECYRRFASKMMQWMQREEDVRCLKMAIQIYVYLIRNKDGMEDGNENHR